MSAYIPENPRVLETKAAIPNSHTVFFPDQSHGLGSPNGWCFPAGKKAEAYCSAFTNLTHKTWLTTLHWVVPARAAVADMEIQQKTVVVVNRPHMI